MFLGAAVGQHSPRSDSNRIDCLLKYKPYFSILKIHLLHQHKQAANQVAWMTSERKNLTICWIVYIY